MPLSTADKAMRVSGRFLDDEKLHRYGANPEEKGSHFEGDSVPVDP
jgi:hypothetical protein